MTSYKGVVRTRALAQDVARREVVGAEADLGTAVRSA